MRNMRLEMVLFTLGNDYKDLGGGNQRDTSGYNKASNFYQNIKV
jgi:hypothetical protein